MLLFPTEFVMRSSVSVVRQQPVTEALFRSWLPPGNEPLSRRKGRADRRRRHWQGLTELVCDGGSGVESAALSGEGARCDLVAAEKMPLALSALQGLLRHLDLLRDPSNRHTFSLKIGG